MPANAIAAGGVKKGDKIHGQKKGKKGEAAAYVTRAQARVILKIRRCMGKAIIPL